MTVKYYGAFEPDGKPKGFYPDDIYAPQADGKRNPTIPASAVEISEATWKVLFSNSLARYNNGVITYIDPPVVPPAPPSPLYVVMLDHENRIRSQEGAPPLTMADFVDKMSAPP
jgi:hypothetical protein